MAEPTRNVPPAVRAWKPPAGPGRLLRGWSAALTWLLVAWASPPAGAAEPLLAPGELAAVLTHFRSEVPKGWSYLQSTTAEGQSLVERHDGARPEFDRWSLMRKNGREPTEDERREYRETRSRRSRAGTAPRLAEQIDATTAEVRHEDAAYLRARIVVHRASRTIETLELRSTGPFRPALGVWIEEMFTRLTFSLPAADRPSLPLRVETRLRGTAFWFRSLDAAMTIAFTDYTRATRAR